MLAMLIVFAIIICCYVYVTDSERVRTQAEAYLSRLMGGRVTVQAATLSIFEGLRLEGVNVYVDDGRQPDSLLFSAQIFSLRYDVSKIIQGQLEASQIIAQKAPRPPGGKRQFARMELPAPRKTPTAGAACPPGRADQVHADAGDHAARRQSGNQRGARRAAESDRI